MKLINQIKKDFGFLKSKIRRNEIDSVLLYGSYAKNEQTKRSDIDICVVAPKVKDVKKQAKLIGTIWQNINANKYDVRQFEALPLYIKIDIIKNHKVIFSKDIPELSYYFYFFRKLWMDQSVNWFEKK